MIEINIATEFRKIKVSMLFVHRPTNRTSMAQGHFKGGSRHRAETHTRRAFPKLPRTPSAFPLKGAPQALGDKPNPPKRVKAWEDGPLRPEVHPVTRHTRPEPPIVSRPAECVSSTGYDASRKAEIKVSIAT